MNNYRHKGDWQIRTLYACIVVAVVALVMIIATVVYEVLGGGV